MPRNNDKPFPCEECRFANLERSECYRNPPNNDLQLGWGCFAGEPKVKRSCENCIRRGGIECQLTFQINFPFQVTPDWHCCYWEGVKE
jgi:hypothetical protein